MPPPPGTRLGVYEITAQIGEGGMGEVYRATDTSLGRQVAVKVLPDAFAADPDRLARFEREAKTLAALNHPHIAQIYGFEKSSGMHALVMELVEGEDLSQRIARGAIPLDEALPIAKQIAEALEAAHEQGIIHRDLKPANIKVRADGTVKVLDFGLAKALDVNASSATADAMNSPTLSLHATQAGIILGTAAYMSPEQASGKPVDKRADVWSFGVVLLEMLTGQRLFDGETISHTLADVLRAPLDFSGLPADTPPAIRDLLRRCLTRDVKKRTRDIGDVRIAIDEAMTAAAEGTALAPAEAPRTTATPVSSGRQALPWAVAGALGVGLLVTVGLWAPWRVAAPAERPLIRLDVDLGADVSLPAPSSTAAVSSSPLMARDWSMPRARRPSSSFAGSISQPQILPGGRAILFTADNPGDVDKTTIQVLTLADGQKKTVIRGGASGRYLATGNRAGHLVYVNRSALFAVPFDVTTLETRGDAVPIVDDLASEG